MRGDLPQTDSPRQRQWVRRTEKRDELIEDRRLKLQAEKICIVRKQGRVQIPLDGRQVERVVFEAGMVAHDRGRPTAEYGESAPGFGGRS